MQSKQANPIRPRDLPRRKATPDQLLRGYSRPKKNKSTTSKVIKKKKQNSSPFRRRRLSERSLHIMHEGGVLRNLVSHKSKLMARAVSDTKAHICRLFQDRLRWRASRQAKIKFWVSSRSWWLFKLIIIN